jgi:hypothetical protein
MELAACKWTIQGDSYDNEASTGRTIESIMGLYESSKNMNLQETRLIKTYTAICQTGWQVVDVWF